MNLGRIVKIGRTAKGWTQEELANSIGITKGGVSNIERNKNECSENLRIKLAQVLNISHDALLFMSLECPVELTGLNSSLFKKLQNRCIAHLVQEGAENDYR